MKRWGKRIAWALIALVVVIVIAASCSSGGSKPAPKAPAATKADLVKEATGYLSDNYKGTTWYSEITKMQQQGTVLEVRTSIYPDAEGKKLGSTIGHALATDSKLAGKVVMVYGQNDAILATVSAVTK